MTYILHTASWTDVNDNFYVFGGQAAGSDLLCDLWIGLPTTGWSQSTAGTSVVNTSGVYPGSLQSSNCGASTCMPGCRKDSATWVIHGSTRSTLYLFGGYGYGASTGPGQLNDLWSYDTQTGAWTWLHGSSETGATASYSGTLDPGARAGSASATIGTQLWLHGGKFGIPDPPVTPIAPITPPEAAPIPTPIAVPIAAPVTPIAPVSPPTAPVADPVSPPVSPPTAPVAPPTVPVAEPVDPPTATPTAVPTNPPVSPPTATPTNPPVDPPVPFDEPVPVPEDVKRSVGSFFDAEAALAVTYIADTWYYDTASNQWMLIENPTAVASIQASPNGNPGPRSGHTGFTYNGAFYVFGGQGFDTTLVFGPLNDYYMYNSAGGDWEFIAGSALANSAGSSSMISSRYDPASWTDSAGNIWMFGGLGTDSSGTNNVYLGSAWYLNVGTNKWTSAISATGSPASCTSNCGTPPHCENIGVSLATSQIGQRAGAAAFWRRQSNYGSIFGGHGYDCNNNFRYLQDSWDIANTAPTPLLIRPIILANVSSSSFAAGYTVPLTGSYFGYLPGTITLEATTGISACTIDSGSFTATSLNCVFPSGSTTVGSGPVNGFYTSTYAMNSGTVTILNVRPSLLPPSTALAYLASATGTAFTVTGAGFGTSASSLSAAITVNGNVGSSCTISSVASTGTSFVCTLPSTSVYSGTVQLQVTFTAGASGAFSTDLVTFGTIKPTINALSTLPANLNTVNNAPSTLTFSGNGFGTSSTGVTVSVTFGGSDTRSCGITGLSATSITCTVSGSSVVTSAGFYSATVTVGGITSSASDLGGLLPTITVPSTLPTADSSNVPSTYTIAGNGFSVTMSEMSVILTYPVPSNPNRTCVVSASSFTSITCSVTGAPSDYAGFVQAIVTRVHTGATSATTSFNSAQANILALNAVVSSGVTTINATTTSITVNGHGLNGASMVLLSHGSLAVPTCASTSTTSSTFTCIFSGVFLESGTYDYTITDAGGGVRNYPNNLTVNPGIISRSTDKLDSIKTSTFTVTGAGFGATGTPLSVTLTNGAVCSPVTSISPTSFNCTLTSAATLAGSFQLTVTAASTYTTTFGAYSNFRPMIVPTSYVVLAATSPTLTIRGAAFLSTAGSSFSLAISVTGPACGTGNTCSCLSVLVLNGTALTCVLSGQRSSGSMLATLTPDSYAATSAVIGVIKPVVRVSTSNIATTAKTLSIIADPSTGFGMTIGVVSVTLSSGACTVTAVSIGSLTCSLSSAPVAGELDATVTVNSVSSDLTAVATVVPAPVITASTAQLSVASSDVIFYGNNFGTTLGIIVNFFTGQTCSPAFVNNTMVRCTPIAQSSGTTLPPAGSNLRVTITKDGGSNTPGSDADGYVTIAKMIAVPVVNTRTLSLAQTDPFLNISGSSFSNVLSDVSVALTLGGSPINTAWYSVYSVTSSTIALALTTDWTTLTTMGPITAVVTVARGSAAPATVATLAKVPTVTSSTSDIATTSTQLIIYGLGFQPTGVNPATMVITATISFGSSSFNCNTASGTDTALTCTLPSNPPSFTNGAAVSVSALVVNGLSMAAGSVQIGTFRSIPFIATATAPAFQLNGSPAALSFTATSIPTTTYSVVVADANGNVSGYCASPSAALTGVAAGTISCETRTWTNAGVLTAQLVGSGGIKSVITGVGYVRAQATITSSSIKIGRKTTTLIINGANFSPLSPIGTQNLISFNSQVTGTVTAVNALGTQLTVVFNTNGGINPAGALTASIAVASVPMSGSAVTVANIVDEPAPVTSENSISLYAPNVTIFGTALSFSNPATSSITLLNSVTTITCASVVPLTDTNVTCVFALGTVLAEGPVSLTAMTLDGVASLTSTIVVATALPIPVIDVSTATLNPDSVTITGVNFSYPKPSSVNLSSSSCNIASTSTGSIICQVPRATLEAGPLYATVTVQNGVTSEWTLIGYIYPTVVQTTTRGLISSTTFSVTGNHFSADLSKVSVVLTASMTTTTQICTVTSSSLTTLKCTSTDLLYVGTLGAVITVVGTDGLSYSSTLTPVGVLAPTLVSSSVYANVSSENLTLSGAGFYSTMADGVVVNLYTGSTTVGTALSCTVKNYTYYNVTCWFAEDPTGGIYTAVISVYSGSGPSPSDPDTALAIGPVLNDPLIGTRRTLLALPDITTDSTSLDIFGKGFSTTPSHNWVQLSSGYCNVQDANSTWILCALSDINSGTLSARVSTNSVSSMTWMEVANVQQGSPRSPGSPELFPSSTPGSNTTDENGTGPSSSDQGWTAGAIAGVVLAAIFAIIIILIVAFTFLLLRKSAGSTANRLLRAAKRGPNARTRSRSARSNTSSTSIVPSSYPVSPGSVRRRDLSKLTTEEEDFVRRIAFADSVGKDGGLDGLASGDEYLFDSSSEYLYRDSSGESTEEEEEYEEDGEELEEDDVESGLQSEQDGASSSQNEEYEVEMDESQNDEEDDGEEEEEYEEEDGEEEEEEEAEEEVSKSSSSSEYLYTSGSSEASSSQ